MLPGYMIPQHFTLVASFPLLPNGKIDRASLPPPRWEEISSSTSTAAGTHQASPGTDVEKALAAIWCRLLGVDRVDADANFFDVGGHSLLVTMAAAEVRKRFGVRLHPARFAVETLAQLAASLEPAAPAASTIGAPVEEGVPRSASPRNQSARATPAPSSESLLARLRRLLSTART
jgi:hypothetical protein